MARRPLIIIDPDPKAVEGFTQRFGRTMADHVDPERPFRIVAAPDVLSAADLADAGAVLALGSPLMLGTPETTWAPRTAAAIAGAAETGTPAFAICFSHQMMAQHLGGELASWDVVKEAILDVTFADEGPFAGIGTAPVVLTHADRVVALGPRCVDLGHGGFGGIQAFRHETLPIWGMQGHPEPTHEMFEAIEELGLTDAFRSYDRAQRDDPTGKRILRQFGDIARSLEDGAP